MGDGGVGDVFWGEVGAGEDDAAAKTCRIVVDVAVFDDELRGAGCEVDATASAAIVWDVVIVGDGGTVHEEAALVVDVEAGAATATSG